MAKVKQLSDLRWKRVLFTGDSAQQLRGALWGPG